MAWVLKRNTAYQPKEVALSCFDGKNWKRKKLQIVRNFPSLSSNREKWTTFGGSPVSGSLRRTYTGLVSLWSKILTENAEFSRYLWMWLTAVKTPQWFKPRKHSSRLYWIAQQWSHGTWWDRLSHWIEFQDDFQTINWKLQANLIWLASSCLIKWLDVVLFSTK